MKDSNVLRLPGASSCPTFALEDALDAEKMTDVLIVSYEDGILTLRSSGLNRAEALYMLMQAQQVVMEKI